MSTDNEMLRSLVREALRDALGEPMVFAMLLKHSRVKANNQRKLHK